MAGIAALLVAVAGLVSALGVAIVSLLKVLFTKNSKTPEHQLYEQYNDHIERLEKEIERMASENDILRRRLDGRETKSGDSTP